MNGAELQTQLLTTPESLQALESEWNELLQASPANNVFLTWEWMSAWTHWLGTACDLRLWTVRRVCDGRLLGLAPLALRRRRLPGGLSCQELILLGSEPAAADHLDFIVRRDEACVAKLLFDCFVETQRECDLVSFEALVPDSIALAPWLSNLSPRSRQDRVLAPYLELPATWEDYLHELHGSTRGDMGRCARALVKAVAPAPVAFRHITRADELNSGMDELIRLHQVDQNAMAHPGAFADPRIVGFHRDVAQRFLRRGWLTLTLMTVGDRNIAAIYGFTYASTWHYFMTGYDREWHRFGPGRQVLAHTIQEAIGHGAQQFDLLRGAERYKWLLTKKSRALVFVQTPVTGLGKLALGALSAASYMRVKVKRMRDRIRKFITLLAAAQTEKDA